MIHKSAVRATDSVIWSGKWSENRSTESRNEEQAAQGQPTQSKQHLDKINFSDAARPATVEEDGKGQPPEKEKPAESQNLLHQMEENNEKLRELARRRKAALEPKTVPSVLGLSLEGAAAKLAEAGIPVREVLREYSASVPPGHVISQLPGPGSRVLGESGILLMLSKGVDEQENQRPVFMAQKSALHLDGPPPPQGAAQPRAESLREYGRVMPAYRRISGPDAAGTAVGFDPKDYLSRGYSHRT